MFLKNHSEELNTYLILQNLRILSNHAPLVVNIAIYEEFIQEKWLFISKSSREEKEFISNLRTAIDNINTSNIHEIQTLEIIVKNFANAPDSIWRKHVKWVWITKHSKEWWNNKCKDKLEAY